jgi:hypothetical protein
VTCARCKEECQSLHDEWRGFSFNQKVCARCANELSQIELKKQGKDKEN